jgi:hypothetical protein
MHFSRIELPVPESAIPQAYPQPPGPPVVQFHIRADSTRPVALASRLSKQAKAEPATAHA